MSNVVVLGTGMAGLGVAHRLHQEGVRPVMYDKNAYYGGHTMSFRHEPGFVFDVGPHISFTKDERIQRLFADSVDGDYETIQIKLNNYWRGYWPQHPVQLHLHGLPEDVIAKVIADFVEAQHQPERPINNYNDWLLASFGTTFAELFPKQYTRKYHLTTAENMSTDWLGPRIYRPTLEEILHGAISASAPNIHYITHFRYPKRGGFVSYLNKFAPLGDIRLNHEVVSIDPKARLLKFSNGARASYDALISSLPLPEIIRMIKDAPRDVVEAAERLACSSCVLVNIGVNRADLSEAHMTYFYDEDICFTRLSFPHMLSKTNAPEGMGSVQAEIYFSDKYRPFTGSPEDWIEPVTRDLRRCGLLRDGDQVVFSKAMYLAYANVIFDRDRAAALKTVHGYLDDIGIAYCGRYGDWGYMWTDESFKSGEAAADETLSKIAVSPVRARGQGVMAGEAGLGVRAAQPAERRRQEKWIDAVRGALPDSCRIGLLGHCGTGNLGDEATIATVLQHIRGRLPAASIAGLSMDPEDTARRHGIPCFALRQRVFPFEREWSTASPPAESKKYAAQLKAILKKTGLLFHLAKIVKYTAIVRPAQFVREIKFLGRVLFLAGQLDLIIVCGGGQLLDWGGPWAFPYTLFKWVFLAKCAQVKCIFLNSGAGPLDSRLSRWFAKRTLGMADYVSLRDGWSGKFLRKIGFRGKMEVVADSVWGLRLPENLLPGPTKPKDKLVIGIAPMAYGDSSRHWVDDDGGYQRLIDNLADFSVQVLERGHRIKLFSSDIWFDSKAIADLSAAIHRKCPAAASDGVTLESVTNIDGLLATLASVDCYVTCRFHGVVFASLLNVPSLALSPHPKVRTLMEDMELADYCIDISSCSASDLLVRFDQLLADMDSVKARIARHVAEYQSLLSSQFDSLFRTDTAAVGRNPVFSIGSVR